ncbi:hypothetical protein A1O7_09494 [Cladophialophora yegresii CBS 114405]|uniref:Uncharacterized protein n=1 Tax=Cladophialophora yegresii CBS 114405 TaxID=1182544 RepID=W9VEV7_9EURO|nr:uncharacterized protein A1O7_09494 [Cladophialophora yegresii CBS 114405]EXJ54157.1 hypothetical protein A1O7_09494 [Cladophialophora yegresii CBS 114405]
MTNLAASYGPDTFKSEGNNEGGRGGEGHGGGLVRAGRNGATVSRPVKISSGPIAAANKIRAAVLPQNNHVADSAPKLNSAGANASPSAKTTLQQDAVSWGAPLPQPSRRSNVLEAPVAFARQIRASNNSSKISTSRSAPKLKFIGANPATIKSQQNEKTSGAGMPRPLSVFRFPVNFRQQRRSGHPAKFRGG